MNQREIKKSTFSPTNILLVLLLVSIAFLIAFGICFSLTEKESTSKLAEKVSWQSKSVPSLGVSVTLTTKYQAGKIYYIFKVSDYNDKLDKAFDRNSSKFIIVFYDKDGFMIDEIEVNLNQMNKIVNDNGNPMSLTFNSSTPINRATYNNIDNWSIRWSL